MTENAFRDTSRRLPTMPIWASQWVILDCILAWHSAGLFQQQKYSVHPNIQGIDTRARLMWITASLFVSCILSSSNNPVAKSSRSVHRGGLSLGQEVFTDLDFADDVSVMAEMLEVLILALDLMNEESSSSALGLEISWNKPQISSLAPHLMSPS